MAGLSSIAPRRDGGDPQGLDPGAATWCPSKEVGGKAGTSRTWRGRVWATDRGNHVSNMVPGERTPNGGMGQPHVWGTMLMAKAETERVMR